jgi:hypothetical protein
MSKLDHPNPGRDLLKKENDLPCKKWQMPSRTSANMEMDGYTNLCLFLKNGTSY